MTSSTSPSTQGANVNPHDDDLLQPASWPASCPVSTEDFVISIMCGNSRLHWALHQGFSVEYSPTLFWRTSPVKKGVKPKLSEYVPSQVRDIIYGPENNTAGQLTPQRAVMYRTSLRMPAMSIFVVSTNREHMQGLASLFRNLPCRLTVVADKDFTIPKQVTGTPGYYEGMGVDRICAVEAAKFVKQTEAVLVIDGGTAMTYTATDNQGRLLGGGIGCGIRMKCRALFDYTHALPYITYDRIMQVLNDSEETTTPPADGTTVKPAENTPAEEKKAAAQPTRSDAPKLPLFAKSTEQAMMGTVLKETAVNLSNIIKGWMEKLNIPIDNSKPTGLDGARPALKKGVPTIILTGGDTEIIDKLLLPSHGNIVESADSDFTNAIMNAVAKQQIQFLSSKYLSHYGIQYMLLQQQKIKKATVNPEFDALREKLLGQRVAAIKDAKDEFIAQIVSGEKEVNKRTANFTYGTVYFIFRSKDDDVDSDYISVFWDYGGIDDLRTDKLYDYLILYNKGNEDEKEKDANRKTAIGQKKLDSKAAADALAEKSVLVKKLIESRTAKPEPQKAPEPVAAPAPAPVPVPESKKKRSREEKSPSVESGTKKAKTTEKVDPKSYLNRRIAKWFEDVVYYGDVTLYTPGSDTDDNISLYQINYDDGDIEDLEFQELQEGLELYSKKEKGDPKRKNKKRK